MTDGPGPQYQLTADDIDGFPEGEVLVSRELAMLNARGSYRLVARPSYAANVLEIAAEPTEGGVAYHPRTYKSALCYRDPELTALQTFDPESDVAFTTAMPHPELAEVLGEDELAGQAIFRGMCDEEFQSICETGQVWSTRSYNFAGQQDVTCWATDARTAASYANSFAPGHCKATFGHPAYVVAARPVMNPVRFKGAGENEVGVPHPIQAEDILAVWQGDVADYNPGGTTIRKVDDHWHVGASMAPNARVVWRRLDDLELQELLKSDVVQSPRL